MRAGAAILAELGWSAACVGDGGGLPARPVANVAVTFAGTQGYARHGSAFLLQQQGGVWSQRLDRQFQHKQYAENLPLSRPGAACSTTTPYPVRPSATAVGPMGYQGSPQSITCRRRRQGRRRAPVTSGLERLGRIVLALPPTPA
jgi:hypothetical protein